ncbi:ATP-binding protein [Geomesophilobacter sediminis]|uniref:histidine kinase n=1 Tax=Geomesophilobacter sediminis TaxID=2798584 RepID=A0A8J7JM86_9BACT|nr:ATP-binding protein [Geomesophilobacter sediminis]MBJ6725760.1 GAF domain-containing protein [Geomesophilobacter sediminis]
MAGRKGQNLLEGALRLANAPGRSHPARLGAVLKHMAHALGFSSATLFLTDSDRTHLNRFFTADNPGATTPCLIPFGSGCAGRCASTRSALRGTSAELHPEEPRREGENEFLVLPLLEGARLIGTLSVASVSGTIAPAVNRKVKGYLPILGLILEGMRLQDQATRSRRSVPVIAELGKLLNPPLPPTQLLPRLIRACTSSGLAACAVVRLNEGGAGGTRIFKGCRSELRPHLPRLLQAEELVAQAALQSGLPQDDQTAPDDAVFHVLALPLSFDGNIMGTFTFFGGPELAGSEERTIAESLVKVLSSAFAEAISSGRISSFFTEKDKKLKELSLLYRMSNTMLSTIKLNKLIHLTLTALTSGPTHFFDRAMLFLTNERSGVLLGMLGVCNDSTLSLGSAAGRRGDLLASHWDITEEEMAAQRDCEFSRQVRSIRLDLGDTANVGARAVLEKRLIFVPEPQSDLLAQIDPPLSAFAVSPLIAHGQVVGVVVVDNALSGTHIGAEDLRFLQLFTNQAGMAIENSMLYNKIEDTNRQLFETQQHLLQKERLAAIGEVATGIAHELKGPLVSIGGFASRLKKKLPKGSGEWENADLIVREVIRLENVLSEILLFAKKATICYAPCNVTEIVKESLAVVTPSLEEHRIQVSSHFNNSERPVLMGDGQQLMQVFINLFLNAVDVMQEGGKLTVISEAAKLEGASAVCVKVKDTGGGIPLESLNNIFTPFYTTKERGTGLGLPIANRIITNHGGKILVNNQPGDGVEFKIILPLGS